VFKRVTSNVQFVFNPNMHSFKKIMKNEQPKDEAKPVILIRCTDNYMKYYTAEFAQTLLPFAPHFDIFYCADNDVAKQYFDIR
jgi:hypothetical protein